MRKAVDGRYREFCDSAVRGDTSDPVAADFGEPQRPVRAGGDAARAAGCWERKFGIATAGCNSADLIGGDFREPQIAVRPDRDAERVGVRSADWKFRDLVS